MSKLSVRLDRFPRGWFVTAVVAICLTGCDALWLDSSPPVRVDGSSTVYLITESVAEELLEERPGFRVTVGICGTGGGFKKFAAGGIDICDASREIKDIEREACAAAGIDFVELEVAYDGIAVVVSEKNDWLKTLTV